MAVVKEAKILFTKTCNSVGPSIPSFDWQTVIRVD